MWGRWILIVSKTHLAIPAGFHTSQLVLYAIYRVSDKHRFFIQLFYDCERQIMPMYQISSDTVNVFALKL